MGKSAGAAYVAELAPVIAIVPRVELPPAVPLTLHTIVAPGAAQSAAAKLCVCPSETLAVAGVIEFVVAHSRVTDADADFVPSATLVAVTVTLGELGSVAGAVNVAESAPVLVIVPRLALPPAIPSTLHVTLSVGLPALAIVAVNACVVPRSTVAEVGDMVTATSLVIVTEAEAVEVVSACAIAATVTLEGEGSVCGAVYSPAGEIVPTCAFPPATALTVQLTAALSLPLTVAANATPLPSSTDALAGVIATVISVVFVPAPANPPHAAITVANVIATITFTRAWRSLSFRKFVSRLCICVGAPLNRRPLHAQAWRVPPQRNYVLTNARHAFLRRVSDRK